VEDEARYAEVLREMVADGKWVVPHLNGTFYPDKPPIYFWLCAIISLLLGQITPASCLLVTWLNTAACVVGHYYFTKKLFTARAAFIGTCVLIASFLFLGCAQIVRMDMLLTFWVPLALYTFYLGFEKQQPKYFYLFYISIALAVLTKGPLGFAFPFLPAVALLVHQRAWHQLKQLLLHPGLVLFLVLIAGWLLYAWYSGQQDFVQSLFFEQMAGRAVKAYSHREPIYFYLMLLPLVLLPWTSFVPRAVIKSIKNQSTGIRLLLWWFVTGFVLISLVSGKLFIYLLPLVPPVTMILGGFFDQQLQATHLKNKAFQIEALIATTLTFGLLGGLPFLIPHFPVVNKINLWPLAFIFLPLLILGIGLMILRRKKALLLVLFGGMWFFSTYAFQVIIPKLNPAFSARKMGEKIVQYRTEGAMVATFRVLKGILNFYAEQLIPEISQDELYSYLDQTNRVLILKENEFRKQALDQQLEMQILSRDEIANEKYLKIKKGN